MSEDATKFLQFLGFVFLGICIGWYCRLLDGNRYLNVASAWFTLTVTHRREVYSLRSLASMLGYPIEIVPDGDMLLIGAGVTSIAGWYARNRTRERAITM